jgi:DNA-binding transcriptional ArsR family regulator
MMGMQICVYTNIGKDNMVNQTLKQEISQLEADFCSALSDPNRLLILYALNDGPRNVTELTNELNLNQPTASRHLKVLREHGLVHTTRQGTTITYDISDRRLIQALDLLRSVMRDRLAYRAGLMEETVNS